MRPEFEVQVVTAARRWIGTPYRHQASAQGAGADCLGLLRGVWREIFGAEPERVPAYTADWAEPGGREALFEAASRWLVPCGEGQMRPGEVLLFRMRDGSIAKHLGLSAEVGRAPSFIHAYCGHGVLESPLSTPWARRIVARFAFPMKGH